MMTTDKTCSTTPLRFRERARRYWRKKVKKTGRRLLYGFAPLLGRQSLIGDKPVFDKSVFPFTRTLEENWQAIRSELDAVLEQRDSLPTFHELSKGQKRISTGDNWKVHVFYVLGERFEPGCARCPATARLLAGIPDLRNAWFSILAPHYHIPAHQGPSKGLIRIHLGLKIPAQVEQCRLRVEQEFLHWQEGQCLVFDDFYEHEVWNDSSEERVVLFLDVDRPMRPLGALVNRLLIAIGKRTVFIKETRQALQALTNR